MDFTQLFIKSKLSLEPQVIDFLEDAGQLPKRAERTQNPEYELRAKLNQSRIISEMYFVEHLQKAVQDVITSNKKLALSNKKYARAMLILTGALVFVGLIQVDWTKFSTLLSRLIF